MVNIQLRLRIVCSYCFISSCWIINVNMDPNVDFYKLNVSYQAANRRWKKYLAQKNGNGAGEK